MAKHAPLMIDPCKPPKVLLLGNGMLKLCGGSSWKELLEKISGGVTNIDLNGIPYAMQPEALCGVNVEEVQRRTAEEIKNSPVHELLRKLLELDFDAILTTNYSYEIEQVLSGKTWTEYQRKRAFCALDGKSTVRDNTYICNIIEKQEDRQVPVFHIHGEMGRKHSLVLSYYSYAKAVARLTEFNRVRGNQYAEYQQENKPFEVHGWLDYFLMSDVYTVGLGLDTSEFDLWWAIERKARENAEHGALKVFITEETDKPLPQEVLLRAMKAECIRVNVTDNEYESAYRETVRQIAQSDECISPA